MACPSYSKRSRCDDKVVNETCALPLSYDSTPWSRRDSNPQPRRYERCSSIRIRRTKPRTSAFGAVPNDFRPTVPLRKTAAQYLYEIPQHPTVVDDPGKCLLWCVLIRARALSVQRVCRRQPCAARRSEQCLVCHDAVPSCPRLPEGRGAPMAPHILLGPYFSESTIAADVPG